MLFVFLLIPANKVFHIEDRAISTGRNIAFMGLDDATKASANATSHGILE